MKRFACVIFAAALSAALSHTPVCAQEANSPTDPWLMRAQTITDDIEKDAVALSVYDRALLWARLGELYWRDDQERARAWMEKAVETIRSAPDEESEKDRQLRLGVARALLSIITPRDKKLGESLSSVLMTQSKKTQTNDGALNAEALVNTALSFVESDPQRAFELGQAAVRAGTASNLSLLLLELRKRESKLSDKLFADALSKARETEDGELIRITGMAAFPVKLWPLPSPENAPVPPDELRAGWLALLAGMLTEVRQPQQQTEVCRSLMWTASPLLDEYASLLPVHAGPVRLALTKCQATLNPNSSMARQDIENDLSGRQPQTVDELLRASRETEDAETKADHLMRAAHDLYHTGKADRALEIIEGVSEDLRDTGPYGWSTLRWLYASSAAINHLKRGDRYAMRKTLDAVPVNLRAMAFVSFLEDLKRTQDHALTATTKRAIVLEFLTEARQLLPRAEAPADIRERMTLALVRLYTEFMLTDALVVFREAIAVMNRAWATREPSEEIDVAHKNALYEA